MGRLLPDLIQRKLLTARVLDSLFLLRCCQVISTLKPYFHVSFFVILFFSCFQMSFHPSFFHRSPTLEQVGLGT